ncbi:MAG TPA: M14 family zinc carboxypeptidase, partial [Polyangia bacterium]|nr:M14 family zinc carboxypeptidase [Polyangia bacterium]
MTASPRNQAEIDHIWNLAENVLSPHDPASSEHTLAVSRAVLAQLRERGVPVKVEPIDVQTMVDQSYATMYAHDLELGKLNVFSPWFSSVQTLEAINSKLDELAAASNGRARVMAIGRSIQGRDIKAMRISAAPEQGDRASVLV